MKIFNQITSFLLACLLLVSTTGFSMYKHYCGENLKEISLFDEVESCHDENISKDLDEDCPFHQHDSAAIGEEDSCCTDEYNRISLEDQLKQLDKNQSNSMGLTPAVIDLGFQSMLPIVEDDAKKISHQFGASINAPPLYILYTQFNFYG